MNLIKQIDEYTEFNPRHENRLHRLASKQIRLKRTFEHNIKTSKRVNNPLVQEGNESDA